jgi:DNA-directed RNA polymerase specialized sigma24 family protein
VRAREDRLKALLVRGLAGDAGAYQAFLQDVSAHVRAFLRRRSTRLPDEVEDLVQETLLAIHKQRHTFDPTQPLSAWVHAIAKYKLIEVFRRRLAPTRLRLAGASVSLLAGAGGAFMYASVSPGPNACHYRGHYPA